jgi:ribosomal protein S27AE
VFSYVVKLLTGELICHEQYLDHYVKIEPVVRHEIPEIPETSLSSSQLRLYKAGDIMADNKLTRNCGNTVSTTNHAEINGRSRQLCGESINSNYTGWQQCNRSTRNNCGRTVKSDVLISNYMNSGANLVKCVRDGHCPADHVVNMKMNTNKEVEKILPEIKPESVSGKVASSQIIASVIMGNSVKENMLQNLQSNSKENVKPAVRTRRTREKQMSRKRMRRYDARYAW